MARDLHATIDAVWRIEAAKIIGALARMVRDVGLAEELAQDALVAALEHWPRDGIPDKPAAWLMATAKNRALDWLRQEALHLRKQEELGADADARGDHVVPDFSDALDDRDPIGEDLLRLVFTACHPVLSKEAQVALTLRLLGGLTTTEIARAFLVPEPTIAQRIVRAKRTLTAARVPFEVPQGDALHERLASVLEVIYLIFNEGYAATAGEAWMRPALCEEALRLGRVLAALAPNEAEVQGLVALMEIQASRLRARTDATGRPILLLDQDRGRWDCVLVGRGLAALERARPARSSSSNWPIESSHIEGARMTTILTPYLSFDGNTREAFAFYERALGAKIETMMSYADMPPSATSAEGCGEAGVPSGDGIMHACLLLPGGAMLFAGDTPPGMRHDGIQGVMLALQYDSVDRAHSAFHALSQGGQVTMPLAPAFWAQTFGMLTDRFGVSWAVNGAPIPFER